MTLGSLPQFLGGWYGSSPSAAGQTFTADLDSSSPASANIAPAAAAPTKDDAADEAPDVKEAEHDQPAAAESEQEAVAHPAEEPLGSTSAADPRSTPALLHTLLLVLLSASTLAAMLFLLSTTAAGPSYNSNTPSSSFAPPAFHTTSSDAFKPFSSKAYRPDHLKSQPSYSYRFPGAARKLYTTLPAAPNAAAAAPAAGNAGVAAAAGGGSNGRGEQLPWWLQYHASSTMRRGVKNANGESRRCSESSLTCCLNSLTAALINAADFSRSL